MIPDPIMNRKPQNYELTSTRDGIIIAVVMMDLSHQKWLLARQPGKLHPNTQWSQAVPENFMKFQLLRGRCAAYKLWRELSSLYVLLNFSVIAKTWNYDKRWWCWRGKWKTFEGAIRALNFHMILDKFLVLSVLSFHIYWCKY